VPRSTRQQARGEGLTKSAALEARGPGCGSMWSPRSDRDGDAEALYRTDERKAA